MKLVSPSVPDLARLKGDDRDAVVESLREYYESDSAPFNYISGTRTTKISYKGYHNIDQLKAGSNFEKTAQGRKSNKEVIDCAAPLAFGRVISSVFDLPRKRFPFGREYRSAYRVPFFRGEWGCQVILFAAAEGLWSELRPTVYDCNYSQAIPA